MKKVRIGIIGAGWWATTAHIPAVKSHPRALNFLPCTAATRPARKESARDFGARHAFANLDEMLALKELDAVIVSSTPNVHYVQAKAALEHGKHVLIEKPMTFTADEARELVELAAQKKLQLLISCPLAFHRRMAWKHNG